MRLVVFMDVVVFVQRLGDASDGAVVVVGATLPLSLPLPLTTARTWAGQGVVAGSRGEHTAYAAREVAQGGARGGGRQGAGARSAHLVVLVVLVVVVVVVCL